MPDPLVLLALAGTGLIAGFVDAIAGGGGLITIPVLISLGLSPVAAIATNKLQSWIGTAIAGVTYWRRGLVRLRPLAPALATALTGSFVGALTVRSVETALLRVLVPVALIAVAGYFLLAPRLTDADRRARLGFAVFVPLMSLVLGYYDGLFGPGTGTFLTIGFVTLFGLGVTRAAAHTKVVNLASNLGAIAFFATSGDVVWSAVLAMALGQVCGGYLGALTGIRFGARIVRPLVVGVSVVLALRLLAPG